VAVTEERQADLMSWDRAEQVMAASAGIPEFVSVSDADRRAAELPPRGDLP
jgi:hypothetical protein